MAPKRQKTPRRLQIVLAVSIGLNLFLIALIGGHVLHQRHAAPNRGARFATALAKAEASMSPRDATAFRAVLRRDAPTYGEAELQLAIARHALAAAVTAPQFDKAKVHKAMDQWRTAWNNFFDNFSTPLVDALSKVSPKGRQNLVAERMRAQRDSP